MRRKQVGTELEIKLERSSLNSEYVKRVRITVL
jgi:hypothetical protein